MIAPDRGAATANIASTAPERSCGDATLPIMVDTARRERRAAAHGSAAAYRPLDHLYVLGSSGIWGASFVLIATSLEHHGPGVVTFLRIAVGAAAMGLYRPARRPVDRRDLPRVLLLAVLWLAFPMTLYPLAQQHISSGLAGMLGASIPVFTAAIAAVVHRFLPAPIHLLGIGVGALGIVLLGLPAIGEGSSSATGVLLIIAACVSYGAAFNVAVPLVQQYGSAPVFWRALLVSVPMTMPYALFGLGDSSWDITSFGANLVLGVAGTAIAFVLLLNLTARVGATRSSTVTYLEAGFAFVLGTLIRHEPVQALEVIGCVVLLAGAWLASLAGGREPEVPPELSG